MICLSFNHAIYFVIFTLGVSPPPEYWGWDHNLEFRKVYARQWECTDVVRTLEHVTSLPGLVNMHTKFWRVLHIFSTLRLSPFMIQNSQNPCRGPCPVKWGDAPNPLRAMKPFSGLWRKPRQVSVCCRRELKTGFAQSLLLYWWGWGKISLPDLTMAMVLAHIKPMGSCVCVQ